MLLGNKNYSKKAYKVCYSTKFSSKKNINDSFLNILLSKRLFDLHCFFESTLLFQKISQKRATNIPSSRLYSQLLRKINDQKPKTLQIIKIERKNFTKIYNKLERQLGKKLLNSKKDSRRNLKR